MELFFVRGRQVTFSLAMKWKGMGELYSKLLAANAGGVACSGLEMIQNSTRSKWPREEVDERLKAIMKSIYKTCMDAATAYGKPGNIQAGANIAGFLKVADSVIEQGCV